MWTVWRAAYIVVLIAWCLSIMINFYITHSDLSTINEKITNTKMGTYNWLYVSAFSGVLSGGVLVLVIALSLYFDDGTHFTADRVHIKILRVLFGFCVEVCSICIISLSSVYMYLSTGNDTHPMAGGSWVVVLGATYLIAVIIDRLFFSPALAYVEFMAAPCVSCFSKNTIIRNGSTFRDKSTYTIYFDRLYSQLPKLHALHSSHMEIDGVSILDILHKPTELGVDPKRTVAAKSLVQQITRKYSLQDCTI